MVNDYLIYIKNRGIVFDENGIPMGMRPRGRRAGQDISTYVYNPIAVVNHGLFLYNDLIENANHLALGVDKSAAFANQTRWLIENRTDKKNMSFWYHNYPVVELDCRPPWKSAMTQGLALSLLLRAYHLAKSEEVSEVAERVANSMKTPTREGGFLYIDTKGDYWYQEYMGNFGYVLNGFIFAMWGVYDYYLHSKDERYKVIFDRCLDTLRKNLRRYDWRMGIAKWTVYDLKDKNPVELGYQKLHVSLLKDLYTITRERFLFNYASLWESYIIQPNMLLVSITRHARAQVLKLFRALRKDG
jgi:hypothetical protein